MTERYYFGNARFATRSDGKVAIRWWDEDPAHMRTWETRGGWKSDEEMADEGWVPVPDQMPGRTITEKEFTDAFEYFFDYDQTDKHREYLGELGITVVPDPEPTNAQSISKLLTEFTELNASCGGEQGDHDLAEFLDAHGVRVSSDD